MYQKLYIIITAIIINASASAQTPLPYYTGFDYATSTPGWQEFRKGVTINYGWLGIDYFFKSAPNCIYHIFPDPSTASTDTTIDWFVSPQFDFSGGAKIDTLYAAIFSVGGPPHPEDFIGLYLLTGSPDPSLATTETLLADFTLFPNGFSGDWNDTTNILIPPTTGASYIAFKYTATNNNFQAAFDDLYISALATGIENVNSGAEIKVYPNPFHSSTTFVLNKDFEKAELIIYNSLGEQERRQKIISQTTTINRDGLSDGIYFYQVISSNGKLISGRLMIE